MTAAFSRRILALTLLAATPWALAQDKTENASAEYVRSHYAKYEHRIPMRDGVRLFTAVFVPYDVSKTYPILLVRTPYGVGPYGADGYRERLGPDESFQRDGFIFVYQDVRGRYMSEGEFVNMRPHVDDKKSDRDVDESTDTYDTIEWLLAHVAGHNGKVGQWGVSYPGFYTSAGAIDSHPALAAVSPQAPIADWFWDDMHHHGAFILPLAFDFFSGFGKAREAPTTERAEGFEHKTPDGYQFFLDLGPLKNANERYLKGEIAFWNDFVRHPDYDEFWQSRNILPHLRHIKAAVMVVGGLFDTEDLYGSFNTYRAIEAQNPGIFNVLVMGPWPHGGWNRVGGESLGAADFGFKTSTYFQENVHLPFFRHFLKGEGELRFPEALVFETGANRWRSFAAWPPRERQEKTLFLQDGGGLAWEPPGETKSPYDEYVSDPAKPVPYTMEITVWWARNYMTEDQRFAAWRPDVLVYQGEELTDDVTLAGPLVADLWVSTSEGDADWIVKLVDVFPQTTKSDDDAGEDLGATQRLVRAEVFRGRFRDSYEHPQPFVPGEVTKVSFRLQDVLHTFRRGHRIMIQIQSTWFPFVDRNPQKYVPNIFEADEDDFVRATHRVYRSPEHPSGVRVGVLP